jgi:hypothetical protein
MINLQVILNGFLQDTNLIFDWFLSVFIEVNSREISE